MKKDLNYIQALEKAVKEKYGDLATQNPKQLWDEEKEKSYIEQQKELTQKLYKNSETREKVEIEGVLLPKKLISSNSNRTCSICNKYSFDKRDDLYINKFKACYKCYVCKLEDNKNG
jgi:Skp family chaperone for outer membrane proteins